jgi:hypothetical protein
MQARLPLVIATALALGPAVGGAAGSAGREKPAAVLEPVRGDGADEGSRAVLHASLAKYLRAQGFALADAGAAPRLRLQPAVLRIEVVRSGGGLGVEVRASVVALDRGRVAAIVEGGARARAATPGAGPAPLTAQALDAAARKIAEDLARRIGEAS